MDNYVSDLIPCQFDYKSSAKIKNQYACLRTYNTDDGKYFEIIRRRPTKTGIQHNSSTRNYFMKKIDKNTELPSEPAALKVTEKQETVRKSIFPEQNVSTIKEPLEPQSKPDYLQENPVPKTLVLYNKENKITEDRKKNLDRTFQDQNSSVYEKIMKNCDELENMKLHQFKCDVCEFPNDEASSTGHVSEIEFSETSENYISEPNQLVVSEEQTSNACIKKTHVLKKRYKEERKCSKRSAKVAKKSKTSGNFQRPLGMQPDICVHVGNQDFLCQRRVLQARSLFFRRVTAREITLPENKVSPDIFHAIYCWMLNPEEIASQYMNEGTVLELYVASRFLEISQLSGHCLRHLSDVNVISEETAFVVYLQATQYQESSIMEMMLPRIVKCFLPLANSRSFLKLRIFVVQALLLSDHIAVHDEKEVLLASARWLLYRWNTRSKYTLDVMKCVRFGLMAPWQLIEIKRCTNNPGLTKVLSYPGVQGMIEDGVAYSIASSCYKQDSPEFACRLRQLDIAEPHQRNWIERDEDDCKVPLTFSNCTLDCTNNSPADKDNIELDRLKTSNDVQDDTEEIILKIEETLKLLRKCKINENDDQTNNLKEEILRNLEYSLISLNTFKVNNEEKNVQLDTSFNSKGNNGISVMDLNRACNVEEPGREYLNVSNVESKPTTVNLQNIKYEISNTSSATQLHKKECSKTQRKSVKRKKNRATIKKFRKSLINKIKNVNSLLDVATEIKNACKFMLLLKQEFPLKDGQIRDLLYYIQNTLQQLQKKSPSV